MESSPSTQDRPRNVAEDYLNAAIRELMVVRRTLKRHADQPIHEYLSEVTRVADYACQDRADLAEVIHDYARPLLGDRIARQAASELLDRPVVLTANHHGVDFFAQSVQSSLLFSLRKPAGEHPRTLPVLACGSIPLNNLTYPRGMLMYRGRPRGEARLPLKLPLFADRYKREMVCRVRSIDEEMVARAVRRAARLLADGEVSEDIHDVLTTLLEEDYGDPEVLTQASYSDQAVMLNQRIWQRLFREPDSRPALVYLELEKIAASLIMKDIGTPQSLLSLVLFQPRICQYVLNELDAQRACWDLVALSARARGEAGSAAAGHGTMFFWGLDECNRRIPMRLVENRLSSCDSASEPIEIAWNPESIRASLQAGKLLPSLFTSYLVIGLARGVTCLGGYYQAEYLPGMQRAVSGALHQSSQFVDWAEALERVPTTGYLSGMQAVMTHISENVLAPAGAMEIIAGGGLSQPNLESIAELTVHQTHLASVVDTVLDLAPDLARTRGWHAEIGAQLHQTLKGRFVLMNEHPSKGSTQVGPVASPCPRRH